jgi:hypothetical protein
MAKKTENYMFMYLLAIMKRDTLFTQSYLAISLFMMGIIIAIYLLSAKWIMIFAVSIIAILIFTSLSYIPIFRQIKRLRPIILEKLKDEL